MPVYSLNETTGAWQYESRGVVTKSALSPTGYTVVAEVCHFLKWSAFFSWLRSVRSDRDNDGVVDTFDAFPDDPSESVDSDGDGVGDNADRFPNDATESLDSDGDGDGVGDNKDAFPDDASETIDTDRDGIGNKSDPVLNSKVRYYHTNLQGTPVVTTTESGEIEWMQTQSAFGYNQEEPASQVDDHGAHFSFGLGGHVEDTVAGETLVYMQQRYYDPELDRFLSVDPVGFYQENPQSFNRYAYGNNNPLKFVDPDGELPVVVAVLALVGGITTDAIVGSIFDNDENYANVQLAPVWTLPGPVTGPIAVGVKTRSTIASRTSQSVVPNGLAVFRDHRSKQR